MHSARFQAIYHIYSQAATDTVFFKVKGEGKIDHFHYALLCIQDKYSIHLRVGVWGRSFMSITAIIDESVIM